MKVTKLLISDNYRGILTVGWWMSIFPAGRLLRHIAYGTTTKCECINLGRWTNNGCGGAEHNYLLYRLILGTDEYDNC